LIIQNIINQETLSILVELANEMGLKGAIQDYFQGSIINQTENRAVLHTAERADAIVNVNGQNVIQFRKRKMKSFSSLVISERKRVHW
jgi:glucose-6-phosphate isomerase